MWSITFIIITSKYFLTNVIVSGSVPSTSQVDLIARFKILFAY